MSRSVRTGFFIFMMSFGSIVNADTGARDAQAMLFRLGYDITVDGAWGPQSQRTLERYYLDQGQAYDGSLDQIDLENLAVTISQLDENVGPLLPLARPLSPICNSNLAFEATRDVLPVSALDQYVSIPSRRIDRERFVDSVSYRLYQWTAGVLAFPEDHRFSTKLSEQIANLAAAQVASRIGRSDMGTDGSNETAHLWQTDFLLTLAYAVLALQETQMVDGAELEEFKDYLAGLVYSSPYQDTWFFNASRCTAAAQGDMRSRMSACQNHTYGKLHLRAVMGALLDSDEEIRAAVELYRYAIDDLAADGALWREASRGAYGWKYYGHGLGHLVGIADLVSRSWFNLWDYESPAGLTIDDAVGFYAASLADPENDQLMSRYSRRNLGIDSGRDYYREPLSLEMYEEVINKRYFSEWLPVYLNASSNSASARQILDLLRNAMPPETTYHYGLNTWCTYGVTE